MERVNPVYACASDNDEFMNYILSNESIRTVIMIGRYAVYVEGETDDFGPAERGSTSSPYITDTSRTVSGLEGRRRLFMSQLQKTVEKLLNAGKRVVLVYPIPEVGYDVPSTLARLALVGRPLDSFTRPYGYYKNRQKFIFEALDSLGQSNRLLRVYPSKRLCDADQMHCLCWRRTSVLAMTII